MPQDEEGFQRKRTWGPKPKYPRVLAHPRAESGGLMVIAGPCSIESPERTAQIADFLAAQGVEWMRGGVFRCGTYPPQTVYGMRWDLLAEFSKVARAWGLKVLVEPVDMRLLDNVDPYVDGFQVGARQMQNYPLLEALSHTPKVVTLKRNMGAKLDEWLGAAEYLLSGSQASPRVHLVERGISTFNDHVRWTLDVSAIAAVKKLSGLPVLVDASHGTGRRDLVEPLTLAGIAAGADGFMIEVHPDPEQSRSDADQAFPMEDFPSLFKTARNVWGVCGGWNRILAARNSEKEPCPAACQDGAGFKEP